MGPAEAIKTLERRRLHLETRVANKPANSQSFDLAEIGAIRCAVKCLELELRKKKRFPGDESGQGGSDA